MGIFGMIITSATEIQVLMYDRIVDYYKLVTFRLDELKIYFQSIFMGITMVAPPYKYTRGIFVNKNTFYLGFTGT
jgi:hypothetical protein